MQALTSLPQALHWLQERVRGELRIDSRQVQPGDGFIAWPGAATDGAVACLVEQEGVAAFDLSGQSVATYPQLKAATGALAAAFYGDASLELDVLAVTGTNGKTSTAWWVAQALSHLTQVPAQNCAMVGTLGIGQPPAPGAQGLQAVVPTGLTTPDPVQLQQAFRRFVDEGVKACAIEASSIGLQEHRLIGTHIRTAIFTNFTQDHLDYHGNMAAYWQAKRALFAWSGLRSAVINIDDAQGAALATELEASGLDVWTVSCRQSDQRARLQASGLSYTARGLQFTVVEGEEGGKAHLLQTTLIGEYNVSNLLGVLAAMRTLGVPLVAAVEVCGRLSPVPGRMECAAEAGMPLVAVDYAHTPDALDQALQALRPLAQQRGGQLWCVFGCGGDRDASKRPLMGAVAAQRADLVLVTSDNPRNELPEAIIAQVLGGVAGHPVGSEVDRARAIAHAVQTAAPADVLLVAGKGHEDYQDVAGVKRPFSDVAVVRQALQARAQTAPMFTLAQALAWLPGASLVGAGDVAVQRVHTDTRTLSAGDLFVALKGERFDANDFLAQARAAGAVAAISHSAEALRQAGLPGLVVPDTRLALGELAKAWRAQFSLPLIAVTGSNGKTTVTQMLASILRAHCGEAALATQGNLNNDIGVPLTLLRLRASHRMGVIELGMNHPGEIAYLAAMTQPTVALVNNAQREHLEFMATVEAVARENGSVISALATTGTAVFPALDAYAPVWMALAGDRPVRTFAEDAEAAVTGQAQWMQGAWLVQAQTPAGAMSCRLHIAGRHNVRNALAATACALAADVPLAATAAGLEAFEPVKGRSRALCLTLAGRELTVVDDTYNANPDSVRAAIDVLAELPGPRLLVLGDMGEVGDQGPEFHAEAGAHARACGIDALFCLGEQTRQAVRAFGDARHFDDVEALNAAVLAYLPGASSVLVKGSRFMKMERVVQAMQAAQTFTAEVADAH
ncbi:MAG: hypothetical protein RLZZ591_873 [Pseudomonadota bacterium]|jgi:murE/murF fusion protein